MDTNKQIVRVDINTLPDIRCKECDSSHFILNYRLKSVPALISQTGQRALIAIPVYICAICDAELKE